MSQQEITFEVLYFLIAVADPGFPVGEVGVDLMGGTPGTPPRSANGLYIKDSVTENIHRPTTRRTTRRL